ncbi:MAG: NAD(P)/FAD-dependent oxidoreductase [Sulfolobales archaeon]
MREFDVAVVGAGPAGLFATYELVGYGLKNVVVIDAGRDVEKRYCPLIAAHTSRELGITCAGCRPCNVLYGVGGAGLFSSGAINLHPQVGGDLAVLLKSFSRAEEMIRYLDSILTKFGIPEDTLRVPNLELVKEWERKAAKAGAKLIAPAQRRLGTEVSIGLSKKLTDYLTNEGVKLVTETVVTDIEPVGGRFKLSTNRGAVEAMRVILSPGRSGAAWFSEISKKLGVHTVPGPLDVGVRLEVPDYVMEPLVSVIDDPKVIMYTKTYDDKVRTFCVNPRGFVVAERYNGYVAVNGMSYKELRSRNTNLALLVTVQLTDPLEDTVEYGRQIAMTATKLGGGRPLIQRLGDLVSGRRSTWSRIDRSSVEPTLKDVTPGDIGMALPYRVVTDIVEAVGKLDDMLPGLASPQNLVYAPEIKFYSVRAVVDDWMQTTVEGLFVAGDGVGLSRGINGAAITGILAARGVLKTL